MAMRYSTGLRNLMLNTAGGLSMGAIFAGCTLELRTGAQPASPDDSPSGSVLVSFDATTTGIVGGLNFEAAATGGTLPKLASEAWTAAAILDGTPGWFRLKAAGDTGGGGATTEARMDGSVGTFGADLNVSSTTIVTGASQTISQFDITLDSV